MHAVKGFADALRVEVAEIDKAAVAITLVQPTAVNTPYPQHARNYMDKKPKLPTPQIDPRGGRCDLNAATKPSRDPEGGLWHASGGGDIYGHRPAP
jgi:NAD(P)-dependent dehydrogenase (short-subunit alcohol dehydrogenase family)